MSDKDSIEVEVGPAKLSASGGSVARIGDGVADLLSPFTQGFGLVGDHIRIFRERSVSRAIENAKKISEERNEPVEPVNPKNLLPWVENASLEDGTENDLSEVWARLLLSGSKEFDLEFAMFTDSLKRMNRDAVNLLFEMATKYQDNIPANITESVQSFHTRKALSDVFLKIALKDPSQEEFEIWILSAMDDLYIGYSEIISIDYNISEVEAPLYIGDIIEKIDVLNSLVHEGLAQRLHFQVEVAHGVMSVEYCSVTDLGARLLARCYPENVEIISGDGQG